MGEVVREREIEGKVKEDGSAASVVRWERFLPRKVLRVLLVEADDSTRQIITALLRKCSYRVASVSDGLKAWEVLKGRPNSIDLILTEVDLPSISGYALLTLVMEHEICKKIPVIMMSSCDSVSTVYKCMLRGAADFLVKPVRINELRNLWQHVWRRQASTGGGHGPQDESVAQQKVEATAENNATSNHSSGYMACVKRNRECIEKGSDAQSSCTKPDTEAERACIGYIDNPSEPKWSRSPENNMKKQKHEEHIQKFLINNSEAGGSSAAIACKDANTVTQGEVNNEHANIMVEACDNNQALGNSSMEAIDLIGAIDNYTRFSYRSSGSINNMNKIDSSLLLDLSLRRSHPSGSVNQVTDERQMLHHSDASAFSRYVNKEMQPLHSTSASVCNQHNEYLTTDKQLSNHGFDGHSDTHGPTLSTQKNVLSLATRQAELSFPCPQQKVFPVRIPVRGIRFENLGPTYCSVMPQIFCTQSGLSTIQNPGSADHQEPSYPANPFHHSNLESKNSGQLHDLHDQNANNYSNQTEHKQWHNLESLDTDHSASSSFCNGGSNDNVSPLPVVRAPAESANEGKIVQDGNTHRATLREAALNKFRLKRKDRCYEKKVRYETRKKLAEQRPRVKGQFVRQVHNDPPTVETDNLCGSSVHV